jgi:2,4-dienoyl-CoA reductase-like NADH-dependent reductase (Old Yellow Enzyme family)/thioredoxin reductase
MSQLYPHIFSPLKVGNVTFKNRVFTAPSMGHMMQNNAPTYPEPAMIKNYLEKAKGGVAQVQCGGQQVNKPGRDPIHSNFDIEDPTGWRNFLHFTDAIHFYDCKASYELIHFGGEGEYTKEAIAAGPVYACSEFTRASDGLHFTQIPEEEMDKLADRYATLAEAVKFCGFDTLLIHGGHGTLLQEFLSPRSNHRTDQYGGSLENRARFPKMVLDRIRQRVGRDLLIEYRISGSECVPGGFEVEECTEFLTLIQDQIDIAHISAGVVREPRLRAITHPTGFLPDGCNIYLAEAVKKCPDIHIPVLGLGAFQDPQLIEDTLAAGKCDIIAMARGTIADPYTVRKAKQGHAQDIVPCIKCFRCLDEFKDTHQYVCSVNPTVGRENFTDMMIPKTWEKQQVAVIGGGPAGMVAAIEAAKRGHQVTIFEKESTLGGQLRDAAFMDFKYDLLKYENYLISHVEKEPNITVCTSVEATPEMIGAQNFDTVLAATGAVPLVPLSIPGIDGPNVMTAGESFFSGRPIGQEIVVIGGGQVGCEVGVHYGSQGKTVTILEMQGQLCPDAMRTYREELQGQVEDHCQRAITGGTCTAITEDGVHYRDATGADQFLPADTVILAMGMRPTTALAESFRGCAENFRAMGDCVKVGNVQKAVRQGFDAAMCLGW